MIYKGKHFLQMTSDCVLLVTQEKKICNVFLSKYAGAPIFSLIQSVIKLHTLHGAKSLCLCVYVTLVWECTCVLKLYLMGPAYSHSFIFHSLCDTLPSRVKRKRKRVVRPPRTICKRSVLQDESGRCQSSLS